MISRLDVGNFNRESCTTVAVVYRIPPYFFRLLVQCCAKGLCVLSFSLAVPTVVCHCFISSLVDLLQVFEALSPSFAVRNPSQGLLSSINS